MSARGLAIAAAALVLGVAAGWLAAAPLSAQVAEPVVVFPGYIRPADPTYNSNAPMRCTASSAPGSTFAEQNRLTFQHALDEACSTGQPIWLSRCAVDALSANAVCPSDDTCGYPIPKKAGVGVGNIFGVQIANCSNVTVRSDGAVLRALFDAANVTDFWAIKVVNSSHIKFIGVVFSQRDITNPFEQDHWVELGDGGSTNVDDVTFLDNRFIEGKLNAGDEIRMLGNQTGTSTRVSVINNDFDGASRSGVSFQRGYKDVNVVDNTFRSTHNGTDIHNEPTSDGQLGPLLIRHNFFDRNLGGGAAVTLAGNSEAFPNVQVWIDDNIFLQGYVIAFRTAQTWLTNNTSLWDTNRGSTDPSITFRRSALDTWITDNWIYRGPSADPAQLINAFSETSSCSGQGPDCVLHDFWILRNRFAQYGASVIIQTESIENEWFDENRITYHNAGDNLYVAVLTQIAASYGVNSGWYVDNTVRQDLQADGITAAGRIEDAFVAGSTTGKTGHLTYRGNQVKGAVDAFNFNGVATIFANMPEGIPVLAGNQLTSITNVDTGTNGAVKLWRTEAQRDSEQLGAAGAIAVSRRNTVITAAGAYTLDAGVRDGFRKHVSFTPIAGAVQVTLSGFGDGSEIDNTASTAGAFDVAWDAASSAWRLLPGARGVSIVP